MLTMTVAATATQRIELLTGVTIAFPRSPMVLAMEAWDLQHYSKGRFAIGLGSQVKGHNERRFGGTWSAPAPRMKEYIQMMQAVWDSWQNGTKPEFLGKSYKYTLMTPNFNPGPIEYPRPKIYPRGGRRCDGARCGRGGRRHAAARRHHDGQIHARSDAAEHQDRPRTVGPHVGRHRHQRERLHGVRRKRRGDSPRTSTGCVRRCRSTVRRARITTCSNCMGSKYLGDKLHALSLRGEWQKMREVITDEELLELAQVSTYDKMPQFLREHREYAKRTTLGNALFDA